MLFNSYEFLLVFLPVTLALYWLAGRFSTTRTAVVVLVGASLFFYGWWNPVYLLLIGLSIGFNFAVGSGLNRARHSDSQYGKFLLILGIAANLGLLGYFKYADFFIANTNALLDVDFNLVHVILPLAISFFTFQQITYLVDTSRGKVEQHDFLRYCLFVTFFPQLIAGPIVHHAEMMPQFARRETFSLAARNISVGLTILAIGLFKKAVLADGIAVYASPVFALAESGAPVGFFTAWGGALAYTLQLYFDFSGYSDMAIGIARLFGIVLPLNFNAPYKAPNIIEFWRRWHMTLSRFLRDYVYIELGGNRRGGARRHANVMITMLVGGLWHGAGWTFVLWGGLHGLFLVVNHLWHMARRHLNGNELPSPRFAGRVVGHVLTLLCVVFAWVLFRAETLDGALAIMTGMIGLNGAALPNAIALQLPMLKEPGEMLGIAFETGGGEKFINTWLWIIALFALALAAPTTQEFMARTGPALGFSDPNPRAKLRWTPGRAWALGTAVLLAAGILALQQVSEFLYFQF